MALKTIPMIYQNSRKKKQEEVLQNFKLRTEARKKQILLLDWVSKVLNSKTVILMRKRQVERNAFV